MCRRCRLPSVLGGPAATQVAAAQNLVALKVEEGKARAEAEALKLGREVAALPEKAALRARDEITALPGKAAQGAKEALFGQQKLARDKVRLAHPRGWRIVLAKVHVLHNIFESCTKTGK